MSQESYVKMALELAKQAELEGEVPVGAIVVLNGEVIGRGYNQPINGHDPTAHAEIIAMRDAARAIGNYRLKDCDLFVTLEPCLMCAGAMVHARIKHLYYGATDPKAGAVESIVQCLDLPQLNHRISYQGGLLSQECSQILKQFFQNRRK